ncbi:MAG: hypothetical protein A3E83_00620 [Gammaproteobacteria bacterium RIFCSPHIGHO2_12_FULL_41_20]|nr:MAG: hypothetical protein A3E83_00620 [Gammaproteobacteria bacterium RIFCSPHIGHO2_12_FULL_41_20]
MHKEFKKLVVCLVSVSLVGCANTSKQDVGTVTGAVAGGLLGSVFGQGGGKVLAVGIGAVAGAFIGHAIGKSMDETDKMQMSQALNNPNGKSTSWTNKSTGTIYKVTPVKTVTVDGNPYCRKYRATAYIDGKKQQIYGTACRQKDGAWQTM